MGDRSVSVKLEIAGVAGYVAGLKRSEVATKDLARAGTAASKDLERAASQQEKSSAKAARAAEQSAAKHRDAQSKIGAGMLVTGAVIAAGVGLAIKAFADFDKEMSGVQAVSNASAADMDKLGKAAMKAGADTVFSASEAAKAEAELAKAGVSTSDILGGALTGSLNLASAGGLDLANAATIAAQAMNIFKLGGKDVSHIADVLASSANSSAADVAGLGDSLKQGGLVAAQTGLSLEETVGTLSAFADNALIGSDAGTSLKTMLQRLVPTSDAAQTAMDDMGFSAYDAKGAFVGMESVAQQLKDGLGGVSEEQRALTMNTIFGSDAVRAANVLYEQGAAGIGAYVEQTRDAGAAQRMASVMLNNLSGDVEGLKGSIETGLIGAGSAGNDVLRSIVQTATGAVNVFNNLPVGLQQSALGLGAVASAALLAGGGFLMVVPKIGAAKIAMVELGLASKLTRASMLSFATGPIGIALAGITVAVGLFAKSQMDAKARADELRGSLDQETGAITGTTRALVAKSLQEDGSLRLATRLGVSHQLLTSAALGDEKAIASLSAKREAANGVVATTIAKTTDLRTGMDLLRGTTDVFAGSTEKAAQRSVTSNQVAGAGYDELLGKIAPISGALGAQTEAQKEVADAAAVAIDPVTGLSGAQTKLASETTKAKDALDAEIQSLQDAGLVVLSTRSATRALIQAQVDATAALKKNGAGLSNNTAKGRDNAAALDSVASSALSLAKSIYAETGSEARMRASLVSSRASLVATGVRFGMTKKQAEAYATSIIRIPKDHRTKLEILAAQAEAKIKTVQANINAIKQGRVPNVDANTAAGRAKIRELQAEIDRLRGKSVTITTTLQRLTVTQTRKSRLPGDFADGGLVTGQGGPREDNIPLWGSVGEFMVNADAYSKHGPLVDAINAGKFADGGRIGGVQSLATGGFVAADFGAMSSRLPTNVPSRGDVSALRLREAKATTALHRAEDALYTLRRTKGHTARQVSAAEDRLANSRGTLRAATRSLAGAENARAAAAKPYSTRFHASASKANAGMVYFLRNIDTLRRRGFIALADQLVMAGDTQAHALAAQAVKSTGVARTLSRDVVASSARAAGLAGRQAAVTNRYDAIEAGKAARAQAAADAAQRRTDNATAARERKATLGSYAKAAASGVRNTAKFYKNLTTISDRGFSPLAAQLLEQNDEQAEIVAEQAAVASNAVVKGLNSSVTSAASQEAARQALAAKFAGVKAAPPGPAWQLPAMAASSYGARPAPARLQSIVVKIGDRELTQIVSATVDGQTQQLVDGLVYGGSG